MKTVATLAEMNLTPTSRVLVFMPHPDDEAVFISGLLQKITHAHIPVRVVTMTAGEKSTLRYGMKPDDDLATVRRAEQAKAFAVLGVTDFEICNFPDGGLETADIDRKMKAEIAQYKPTHMITLEPDGIYGHPDHIAVSKAVTKACNTSIELLYATVTPNYHFPTARSMAKKQVIKPIFPEFKMHLTLNESRNKIKTFYAHRSQFRISLFHPKPVLMLLLNDMLCHEYYCYRKETV